MDFKKNLKLLPRKRIFDLMEQIPSHPLSMIIAPMGYGKTASLRSYIERTELESLWMTMPRATNLSETELFWFLLVRAVTRRDAAFAQRLSRMGFPQNSIDVFRIIDMLHDLPPERPLLVVIDDLHFIESAAVYEFIYQVGCSGIPWLRIVILSRTYPNFPTAEMELKGTLFVIGPQELAFTAEEADEYYALVQFDPPAEVRRHIFRISQGWIASILLLVEGYQNTGRLDDNASINDMFVSSVFRYYSEYEKRLLTQVAVLDTFTQKMLNYVLDDPNASAAVESACKANAFIFRNQQGRYCFHQMFRDFLLSGQAAPLQDSSVFLHRAAQWYSDNGNLKEAIRYWMIANDRDRIMETLEIIPPMEVLTLNLDTMNSFFIEGDEEQRFRYPYAFLKNIFYQLIIYNSPHLVRYRAIAKYHLYGLSVGLSELKRAVELAVPDHILAPFVECLPALLPMLEAYSGGQQEMALIRELLGFAGRGEPSTEGDGLLLTRREIEVMEYLSEGYSQVEVGQKLFIAQNTVKRHLQNIYHKLDASNKTQAINRYKRLFQKGNTP